MKDRALILFFAYLVCFFPAVALIIRYSDEIDKVLSFLAGKNYTGVGLIALALYLSVRAGRNYSKTGKLL